MKEFTGRSGALRRLDGGTKRVYTAFLAFVLAGLASALLLHGDGLGADTATAAAYWRGDEAGMVYPKSYRQILELTHFHLFTEPLLWLVIAHLYNLGSAPPVRRKVLTIGTLVAIAGQIALPWATAYGSPAFGALFLPVHVGMAGGLAYMAVATLGEMWARPLRD